jgi:hypothetical protein
MYLISLQFYCDISCWYHIFFKKKSVKWLVKLQASFILQIENGIKLTSYVKSNHVFKVSSEFIIDREVFFLYAHLGLPKKSPIGPLGRIYFKRKRQQGSQRRLSKQAAVLWQHHGARVRRGSKVKSQPPLLLLQRQRRTRCSVGIRFNQSVAR